METGSLNYGLTRRDWLAYQHYAQRQFPARRAMVLAIPVLIFAAVAYLLSKDLSRYGGLEGWWARGPLAGKFVPVMGLLLVPLVLMLPRIWARRIASLPGNTGPRELNWSPAGLRLRLPDGVENSVPWQRVDGIDSNKSHLYMVLGRGKGVVQAIVVPRSAFATPADADALLAEARRLWQAARVPQVV